MSNRSDSTTPDPPSAQAPNDSLSPEPARAEGLTVSPEPEPEPRPPERWDTSPVLRETFLRTALGQVPAEALREASRVLYFAILSGDDTTKPARERVSGEHVREALEGAAIDLEHLAGFLRDCGAGEVDAAETETARHWRETADSVAEACAAIAEALRGDESLFPPEAA